MWPFIETYWLASISLFSLIPDDLTAEKLKKDGKPELRLPFSAWHDEKVFLNRCQFFAKTLYYEGDLSYFESINKETIKNALTRLQDMGIILLYKGAYPPTYSKPAAVNEKKQTWISVHPDWIPFDPLPSLSRRDKVQIAPGLENEVHDTISPWYFHEQKGKLWDFCEHIGKFRREGKNRRDTATVSSRVLRLARMSSLWSFDVTGKRQPTLTSKL